jgi:hypothetical protein
MPQRTLRILPDPARPYGALKADLVRLGWVWTSEPQILPLLPGEPEWVEYTHPAGGRLRYEFNPAIGLRQVEATAAEEQLAGLSLLPRLYAVDVEELLHDSHVEAILRGLFAVRALGLTESLFERVRMLREHEDDLVERTADSVLRTMSFDTVATGNAIDLQALCRQATPILAALIGPEGPDIIERLRPRLQDYARVFEPAIAAAAQTAYEMSWPPVVDRIEGIWLRVDAAPACMLRDENELSTPFPGGYRAIAAHLNPDRIWLVWRYRGANHEGAVRYDGFVWLDDRWVWLPKPYRVLRSLIPEIWIAS